MIGQTISQYKILEKIGEGGMGEVYLAEDTKLKRKVALKFLPQEFTLDKDAVERFQREAQAAAALNHTNIVTIYDINQHEDQTYMAMEYVEGQTLKEIICRGDPMWSPSDKIKKNGRHTGLPLQLDKIINITIQICEGLSKAHEAGIVHRDIKPQNILIDKDNRVKILDFGLAKLKGVGQLTKETSTLGTVNYMSPEQAMGKEVDHRTDIWSLGVVLYEMLTGKLPFQGDYEQAVIYSILNEEPDSLLKIRPELPVELNQIINKSLEKNPSQRYQNIENIKTDLLALDVKETDAGSIKKKMVLKPNRTPRPLTIGLGVLFITAIIVFGYLMMNRSEITGKSIDSLAVLPLENLSGDSNQDYFSDGMTEALITELSRIKSLKVISRTSVMRFKNTRQPLPEIARQLKVDAIVEGSVLRAGDKVRITTQLIEAESDRHLWAESYERDLKDILSLQKEVAKTIANQVKATLTQSERDTLSEVSTIDPKAHKAFLKGKYFLNQISVKGAQKALDYFKQVIEIEPEFAPAYAKIASAYNLIVSYHALPLEQGWSLVREWAEKALQIDKNSSDAYMLIADVKFIREWDWPGAEADYKQSIKLNPNNFIAYNWYSTFLSSLGRNREALDMSKKALELGPLSIEPYYNGIHTRLNAGMIEQAEELLKKVKELHPQHPVALGMHGMIQMRKSEYAEAARLFEAQLNEELSPGMKTRAKARMAFALAKSGKKQKAREMLEILINISKTSYVSSYQIALIYLALDETDKTFNWLEKAYDERGADLVQQLKVSPFLDKIRPDPRFKDLLRRMKLDQ